MDEQAWSIALSPESIEYAPLRVLRDDDRLDPGSDPILAFLGTMSELNEGERVATRLLLRSLGPGWSEPHAGEIFARPPRARPAHGRSLDGRPRPWRVET